jgi:broad specificity phosphatase PhoE
MRRLVLARHGQSVSNAVRRFQGVQDVPLSELGQRQAEALGAALARRRIAAIYASPLQRAHRTAEIVAAATGVPLAAI